MDLGMMKVTPTQCLSHCKRMAWRDLARTFNGHFQEDNQGFEGTTLMLVWGLSTHPPTHFRGPVLLLSSLHAQGWVIYLHCSKTTLLQTLISSSSSSPPLKTSLPFPSLFWKLPFSFHIPSFLPSCLAADTVLLPQSIRPLSVGKDMGAPQSSCCNDRCSLPPHPILSWTASLPCPPTSHLSQPHWDVLQRGQHPCGSSISWEMAPMSR